MKLGLKLILILIYLLKSINSNQNENEEVKYFRIGKIHLYMIIYFKDFLIFDFGFFIIQIILKNI